MVKLVGGGGEMMEISMKNIGEGTNRKPNNLKLQSNN